jgi:hypothetical protein
MKHLYHSYQNTVDFFTSLAQQHPQHVRVESIGKTWEQREIVLVTISGDISSADSKPALFYTGTIHAREYIGVELAIAFARHCIAGMHYDPRIQEAFKRSTLYMVPCANPDGLEYSRNHFSFWRKNRRENADGSIGVDLNRNFSEGFKKNNNPSSNVYSGPHPFSEPETQALKDFVESHPNISIALDYHSQGNVFFPAHNFRHENTIDTTDMNVLCANMAEEIRKVSGREYGIHQGKPPASLISGSGREYYYSKGIIGTVVEVGTQNISDYLNTMSEHINEHIPALLTALKEVPNYAAENPLHRPDAFQLGAVTSNDVELFWEYSEIKEEIYFELYRSTKYKAPCNRGNLLAITKSLTYIDTCLESSRRYYYRIRAVDRSTGLKSAFAPYIRVMTTPDRDEMTKTLHPIAAETGYLGEKIKNNKPHFGRNSLFTGINTTKGECIALLTFPLETMPDDAIIKSVRLNLYPINRVSATIEKYGEWNVSLVEIDNTINIHDFHAVKSAPRVTTVGRPTKSQHLTQGIWRNFTFSHQECTCFEEQLGKRNKISFLLEGPSSLLPWRDSQIMQWDIGYGPFGYGLEFRPHLEIVYTQPTVKHELCAARTLSVAQDIEHSARLLSGFENDSQRIYGFFDFSLDELPDFSRTIIESAHLELTQKSVQVVAKDVRFHVEMIEPPPAADFTALKNRKVIEKIGSEASAQELRRKDTQPFPLDVYTINMLEEAWRRGENVNFTVVATSATRIVKNNLVEWENETDANPPKLIINTLEKRRFPVDEVENLTISRNGDVLKLAWDNPTDPDFRGVVVVKNAFRPPQSPYDGQKLYGGRDNFTTDKFGADDVEKYYAVFSYDSVPNYSEPAWLHYNG